jgi:hypothetical protein
VTSDTTGIFVAVATGNDTTGCGTRTIPCKSVSRGITEATQQSGKTSVFVASGAYPESITLTAGLTIEGGWSASGLTWTPICDSTTSNAVTIQGTTSATVTAQYSGASALRDLTIETTSTPSAGESVYGVFATGSLEKANAATPRPTSATAAGAMSGAPTMRSNSAIVTAAPATSAGMSQRPQPFKGSASIRGSSWYSIRAAS